jgi:hypothetical protein
MIERFRCLVMVEAAVTGSTLLLTHVTYLNTYKDTPHEEKPHVKASRVTVYIVRILTVRVRHHGRWVIWQISAVMPKKGGKSE